MANKFWEQIHRKANLSEQDLWCSKFTYLLDTCEAMMLWEWFWGIFGVSCLVNGSVCSWGKWQGNPGYESSEASERQKKRRCFGTLMQAFHLGEKCSSTWWFLVCACVCINVCANCWLLGDKNMKHHKSCAEGSHWGNRRAVLIGPCTSLGDDGSIRSCYMGP
jgi:hypothetical protein